MTMYALIAFIIFCQALGAIIGASMTVWGEIEYAIAMRDGHINKAEGAHLRSIAHGLRYGMTLLLVASLALVIVSYYLQFVIQPALTTGYWAFMIVSLIIIYTSWALSRNRIAFEYGSAIVFTGWWFLTYLSLGFFNPASFSTMMFFFVFAVAIFYIILLYSRMIFCDCKKA